MTTTISPTSTQAPLTTFITTNPIPTVSDLLVSVLEQASGYTLNLTNRYCDWNVTYIIKTINDTSPETLYSAQYQALLPSVLPPYLQKQLPSDLIAFYGIDISALPETEECNGGSGVGIIGTPPPFSIDFCVGPLVHTDLLNPVNENTGNNTIYFSLCIYYVLFVFLFVSSKSETSSTMQTPNFYISVINRGSKN